VIHARLVLRLDARSRKAGVLYICVIDFVGIDTLREIAESYYRTVTFLFDENRVDDMLAPFLFGEDI
jgi:hypothetical protein